MINSIRTEHSVGVAEYMYHNAHKYGLDKNEMYVLGLLHDIRYIYGIKENHEEKGANLLQNCGMSNRFTQVIKFYGSIPKKVMKELGCSETDIPKELLLLWEGDMSVDLKGNNVGFDKRLEDIGG